VNHRPSGITIDPAVEDYARALVDAAVRVRLPELFREHVPGALYQMRDRHGVSTVVMPTTALSEEQITGLLRFRLAQYLLAGFLDAAELRRLGLQHEPRSGIGDQDIHVIACTSDTGEILCYVSLRGLGDSPSGATLRTRDRPLFSVEEILGWGIFNRLMILPDLPVDNVRELGRFVKNQQLSKLDPQGIRAPVECGTALFRALCGPLLGSIGAVIGQFEEGVAKRNTDFFHYPTLVFHGALPFLPAGEYGRQHFEESSYYPFAFLVEDLSGSEQRVATVERALDLPGQEGLASLLTLRASGGSPGSTLEPVGGLPVLTDTPLDQHTLSMDQRQPMLALGWRLHASSLFESLTPAEATVLGSFMERLDEPVGAVVIRQGELGDDLYVIDSGQVEVRVSDGRTTATVALRGPGECFGEIGLLHGGVRSADIVAVTPVSLLKLGREAYLRYLAGIEQVQHTLVQTAADRAPEPT
jgi:hypothetical protein